MAVCAGATATSSGVAATAATQRSTCSRSSTRPQAGIEHASSGCTWHLFCDWYPLEIRQWVSILPLVTGYAYACGGYESPKTIPTCTFQVGAVVVNRRTMWVGILVGVGVDMTCGCANFDVVSCGCGCEYTELVPCFWYGPCSSNFLLKFDCSLTAEFSARISRPIL